ncbi:GGDEF domain-containing protein [Cellulomonas cellasea]|uniref:Diguanylate cyclase (GGDEF)-like protein n=1 Tax=Cellulomonas cellasea TaxID=43670 RepID=A0A7W4UED0_9CELL|nr:GGDEF domain-containing protein [Cellulomonas cellasea]MBB2922632.1 diguanylate cyclase (GGDEF)-like protein [Cellulomonas cellasea]
MNPRGRVPAHAALVATGLAVAATFLASSGVLRASMLVLASAIPLTIVLVLLARHRVRRAASWTLLCAALGVLTVNGLAWVVDVSRQDADPAEPGLVVDVTLPVGYLLLFAAAIAILLPFARRDSGGLVEAAVLWLACASLLWTVLVHPALVATGAPVGVRLYTLLLVVLVSGIGGMVLRAALVHRAARPALVYVCTSVLLTLVGNVAIVLTTDPATGLYAPWVATLWILGYSCLAAAAVHPTHARVAEGAEPPSDRLGPARLTTLGVALGLNPLLAGLQEAFRGDVDWLLLTVGTALIVPLVVARIAGLSRRQARAERALAHLATHDELTGLENRRAGLEQLQRALDRVADGRTAGVTVLFLDVDGLKDINDTYGHGAGDALITAVAERLVTTLGPGPRVARFGGDEFLVVDEGGPDTDDVVARLRACLDRPVPFGDLVLGTGASIGVHHVPAGARSTTAEAVAHADQRMYEDKRRRAGERRVERTGVEA